MVVVVVVGRFSLQKRNEWKRSTALLNPVKAAPAASLCRSGMNGNPIGATTRVVIPVVIHCFFLQKQNK
jgi:hypothetical protein